MGTAFTAARARLLPLFERIGAGTLEREQTRTLPYAEVTALRDAGFGRLRIPTEFGGDGLDWPSFAELLVELATVDSNLPQIFRGHIAYVEELIASPASDRRERWLRRLAAGELVGNAWSEVGSGALGTSGTVVSGTPEGTLRVDGRKFYTTGSIFADWIDATATHDGTDVTVLIPRHQTGVTVQDDWDGFGQPLTGTGAAIFDGVVVDPEDVAPFVDRFRYQTAVYQLVLLSVLAGISSAVERDAGAAIRSRTRVYSHGTAARVHDDPQVLQIVGEISAAAAVARSAVRDVARAVQRASELSGDRDSPEAVEAVVAAELGSAQAQIVLSELVTRAATRLFDTVGASAISGSKGLDRHWRNARAVASHNPWIFKARELGNWSVNGVVPEFVWTVGVAKPTT